MDFLDVFIHLVKQEDAEANKAIRLLFKSRDNGEFDEHMCPYFTNTFLSYSYKDGADPSKRRLIGMPTALRRIITNNIARTFHQRFTHHLLQYNFAIGIDNGTDFFREAPQLVVEKYTTVNKKRGQTHS